MGNMWLKIKVWTKLVVFVALLIYLIIFVAKNSARQVTPWFWFRTEPTTTVLILVLTAFVAGVLCAVLFRTTLATLRQVRELRDRNRNARVEREVADMRSKAAMVQTHP